MRRRRAEKRDVLPDPKHNSKLITRFVNVVMEQGKKAIAERIVYNALDIVSKKTDNTNSLELLQKAIDNVRPLLEIKPRRVGGATYQIPIEVKSDRGTSIAMRWLRD
ncbi:MAG: 30S ribosomal protein S7, partial [Candidatus Omnitrophica bacterium]|nr:30S ribosomal protein S7 [Candidatus Omnitrophota bacterium]